MATTTKDQPALDWSPAPRGPVSGAVTGFLGLAALAAVGHQIGIEPVFTAAGTLICAVGSILHSAREQLPPATLLWRLCRALGGGGWVACAAATTPWDRTTLLTLGLGALAAAAGDRWFRPATPTGPAPRQGATVVLRRTTQLAREWEQRIERVTRIQAEITDVRHWDNGAGYTLTGLLPLDGSTREQLQAAAAGLAAAARLPDGCGIDVDKGPHRGSFVMGVMTTNRLIEDVPWHGDTSPRDIHDPATLGEHRDSSTMGVPLREESVVIIGQKGSGKTTVMHGLIWETSRCFNALAAVLDINGGSLAQPWLHPWLEGQTDRPALDWVAADPDEALVMSETLLQMATDRKNSYRHLKVQRNLSLLPMSAELPSYQLFVDEGGELMSPQNRDPISRQIRENVLALQRMGRDAGFNVIISSLRAVQDMIDPAAIVQSSVKIGMYCDKDAELAYLFGWGEGANVAELDGPGTGFYRVSSGVLRPYKQGYLLHGDIAAAAVTIANRRPDLDAAGIAVGGDFYRDRLRRMREAFGGAATRGDVALPTDQPRPRRGGQPSAAPSEPRLTVLRGGAASWPDPAEIAAAARHQMPAFGHDLAPDRVETLHAEQIHELPAAEAPVPELLVRAVEAFAGDDRIHSVVLAERLGVDQVELTELLRAIGVRTLARAFMRGGEERRGYARTDLQTAAHAIRVGDLAVPPEVADWPAA